ncbi:MAG: tRNA pseudouridine55 synthase [Parcubacteria group bacterium Gr01-1014_49]|nr:MAG: tRNA pseudouridine55 synthase [Parcubacteria group bacterium Gr01-1014_49]
MKKRVVIEKCVGETPLMALQRWKQVNPAYKSVPASYAGRLDPMARGKLLVLLGEECKKQKAYTGLDKEYEIEVLLDAGSDTGDALGLVKYAHKETRMGQGALREALRAELGTHLRAYPQFSSKTVGGKPLFLHALEGGISAINIPKHEEHIYRIKVQEIATISSAALAVRLHEFLARVPKSSEPSKLLGADFRIGDVRASWERLFAEAGERNFTVISLRIACGSGTYMRSFAGRIGETLGTQGLALSINRTRIGTYWKGWWIKSF